MVTTGADIPILKGVSSAALPGVVRTMRATTTLSHAADFRKVPSGIVFSSFPPRSCLATRPSSGNRLVLAAAPFTAASHIFLDQAPDAILDGMEAGFALHPKRTRALDLDSNRFLHPAGTAGKDEQ